MFKIDQYSWPHKWFDLKKSNPLVDCQKKFLASQICTVTGSISYKLPTPTWKFNLTNDNERVIKPLEDNKLNNYINIA